MCLKSEKQKLKETKLRPFRYAIIGVVWYDFWKFLYISEIIRFVHLSSIILEVGTDTIRDGQYGYQ